MRRKIGRFRGILQKKVKIRSIFRSKCSEKSAAFTGNFGGNFDVAKKQSVKSSRFGVEISFENLYEDIGA